MLNCTEWIILALNWNLKSQTHRVSGENAITTANSPRMMEQKQKTLPKEDVRWLTCFTILFAKRQYFKHSWSTVLHLISYCEVLRFFFLFFFDAYVRLLARNVLCILFLFCSSSHNCTTGKVINFILLPSSGYTSQQTHACTCSKSF